jgi:hypothetical protein
VSLNPDVLQRDDRRSTGNFALQQSNRHPEVRVVFDAPRRMLFSIVRAAILRGAQESARTSG